MILPIKTLKDKNGNPFVPVTSPQAIKDSQGRDLQEYVEDLVDEIAKSDYEEVIITVTDEENNALENISVAVQVENEEGARNLTTNSSGQCTTNINKGLLYTVEALSPSGYLPTGYIQKRALNPKRYVNIVLLTDNTSEYEHLKVVLTYSNPELDTADHINVTYDNTDYSFPAINNIAEGDIPINKQFIISFQEIEGYKSPRNLTFTSAYGGRERVIAEAYYQANLEGYRWLLKDGTEKQFNAVEASDYSNIFGLIVCTQELAQHNCGFIVPLDKMLSPNSGNYLSQNVGISTLGMFNTEALALTDYDGEMNCDMIRQYISDQADIGVTVTSGVAQTSYIQCGGVGVTAFANNVQYVVGNLVSYQNMIYRFTSDHKGNWNAAHVEEYGVGYIMPNGTLKHCFTPSYAQLYAYRSIYTDLRNLMANLFGVTPSNITSGWWSSTQYSDTNGVILYNGRFGGTNKSYAYALLSVLAYSS